MSTQLRVVWLSELSVGHSGDPPVAKDAIKGPHHDWVLDLTYLLPLLSFHGPSSVRKLAEGKGT